MTTIKQIRLVNLLRLSNERTFIKDFCSEVGISPAYYSQLTHGIKGIGGKVARQIEERLGLEPGWMDVDHDADKTDTSALAAAIKQLPEHLIEPVKNLIYAIAADSKRRNRRAGDEGRDVDD